MKRQRRLTKRERQRARTKVMLDLETLPSPTGRTHEATAARERVARARDALDAFDKNFPDLAAALGRPSAVPLFDIGPRSARVETNYADLELRVLAMAKLRR